MKKWIESFKVWMLRIFKPIEQRVYRDGDYLMVVTYIGSSKFRMRVIDTKISSLEEYAATLESDLSDAIKFRNLV